MGCWPSCGFARGSPRPRGRLPPRPQASSFDSSGRRRSTCWKATPESPRSTCRCGRTGRILATPGRRRGEPAWLCAGSRACSLSGSLVLGCGAVVSFTSRVAQDGRGRPGGRAYPPLGGLACRSRPCSHSRNSAGMRPVRRRDVSIWNAPKRYCASLAYPTSQATAPMELRGKAPPARHQRLERLRQGELRHRPRRRLTRTIPEQFSATMSPVGSD
jgi:hypothetical protein